MNDESENVIAAKAQETVEALTLDWQGWLRVNGPRLLLFARQQTRNGLDAEDAMQDALVKLAKKVDGGNVCRGDRKVLDALPLYSNSSRGHRPRAQG